MFLYFKAYFHINAVNNTLTNSFHIHWLFNSLSKGITPWSKSLQDHPMIRISGWYMIVGLQRKNTDFCHIFMLWVSGQIINSCSPTTAWSITCQETLLTMLCGKHPALFQLVITGTIRENSCYLILQNRCSVGRGGE